MNNLKVTLVKSAYGRLPNQRATLEALGLRKINCTVVRPNNDAIKGMVDTVHHLVRVEEML